MRVSLLASLPYMMAEPTAFRWLCLQESLLKAPNTVEAYARGIDDWLRFCRQNDVSPTEASQILALYVRHLNISRNRRLPAFVIDSLSFDYIVTTCEKKD
jgi:hypothetical protein